MSVWAVEVVHSICLPPLESVLGGANAKMGPHTHRQANPLSQQCWEKALLSCRYEKEAAGPRNRGEMAKGWLALAWIPEKVGILGTRMGWGMGGERTGYGYTRGRHIGDFEIDLVQLLVCRFCGCCVTNLV